MINKRSLVTVAIMFATFLAISGSLELASANSGFSDQFSSSTLNEFWSTAGSGSATFDCSVNPGYLRITSPCNLDLGGSNDNAPRIIQPVTDDFVAITEVTGTFTAAGVHAGLLVWKDSTHFMRVEVRDVNKVQIGGKNGGAFVATQYSLGSAINPIYLKLEKTGTTITGYWSSDGLNWNSFGSYTLTGSDPVQVGLFVINQNASPATFSTDFNYFTITPDGSLVLPESPIGTLAAPIAAAVAFGAYALKTRAPKKLF